MEPDADGYFGAYGGAWVNESLSAPVARVERAFLQARQDPAFAAELARMNATYGGRPTPLYHARRLSQHAGAAIHLKREDLVHGGAHKFNNVMGQALLAQRMGAARIIAETGAGQHGVATAMAGAVLGIPVEVFMGAVDMGRQAPNVQRMRLLGAQVHAVSSGSRTLKDAVNDALRAWAADPEGTYYCIGSAVGPHPYPLMVREFQRVIGEEARAQFTQAPGGHPDAVVACVGGGSNAIGTFTAFLGDPVRLVGVEAAGDGIDTPRHAATLARGSPGILHGARSYVLQDDAGQVLEAHSVSAGLDYPGVGPEHAYLRDAGRVEYASATDAEALAAARLLARLEGILPALESAHAIAHATKLATELGPQAHLVVTLSGRGDKDLARLAEDA
ncbi:MAG: tryptophan synthase beta chain [Thermoplasmata archaeon]|jgi:tryptophan synthase beta chain|nr:tryptophan synthase beta chain [Thermoplasmata archaeon]